MMKPKIAISQSNEMLVVREMTEEEFEQHNKSQVEAEAAEQDAKHKEIAKREAREAAIAHAKSLGFTDEMIAVMYPNLAD